MSYFTAQNFVYWTIVFVIAYIWMAMVVNRVSVMADRSFDAPLTFTGVLILFFTWPIWLVIIIFIDLLSLVFPVWLAKRMGKQ